jgi:hypothetical protein
MLARIIHDLVEHGAIPRRFPGISTSVVLARRQVLLRAPNADLPENHLRTHAMSPAVVNNPG